MYDLVIQDSVGAPYTGRTTSGIGGSEHFVIKLARELAACGLKVLVRNNCSVIDTVDSVQYQPITHPTSVECKTLLLQRHTPLPNNVDYEKLVIQVHDIAQPNDGNLNLYFKRLNASLVCSSSWQRSFFPEDWKAYVIPPMLHRLPQPLQKKEPTSFIFASAALKGWDETLLKWRAFKKLHKILESAKLYVISSGYDEPRKVDDDSIVYLGSLTDEELYSYINRCAGLFYVNVWEETFCATAAIAEQLETRTHILCRKDRFGALKETVSDHRFLTDNPNTFMDRFVAYYDDSFKQISYKDYSISTTLRKWREALNL